MVKQNRPPPAKRGEPPPSRGRNDHADFTAVMASERHRGRARQVSRRGLEWSLRSLHQIDTGAQHFLSSYYGDDDDSDSELMMNGQGDDANGEHLEESTAYEIFKSKDETKSERKHDSVWASLNAPLRTGIVDGKKVVFELRTNVTQRPKTSRSQRLDRRHIIQNSNRSSPEVRLRFWLMHFKLTSLTACFLGAYVALNVFFAGLFYALDGRCCGNPELTFGQVFSFSIQTSSTIGYGVYAPKGTISNLLVLLLYYISTLMNTLFAGLLFTKFATPVINVQFSDVITYCNVNGVPCLSVRLGNADGYSNRLTDINVRFTYSYQIPYVDHKGEQKYFRQTEELPLLSNRQHGLLEVWTLRHVVDENSPLFGLHFDEHPANKIYIFSLSVDAVQDLSKASVNVQTQYGIEDIMIGHSFQSLMHLDDDARVCVSDYSKMSDTEPYPVWYPAKAGDYDTSEKCKIKSFGPH
jgi:inward rectifier potassium channel